MSLKQVPFSRTLCGMQLDTNTMGINAGLRRYMQG